MTVRDFPSFVLRNLLFAWRKNVCLLGLIALATALITGALMLGSSVGHSLEQSAYERTGELDWAMLPQSRWVNQDVEGRLVGQASSVIQATAYAYDADALPVKVNLYGVDKVSFYDLAYGVMFSGAKSGGTGGDSSFWASAETLQSLGLKEGENLLLRLPLDSHYAEGISWSLNDQEMQSLRRPVYSSLLPTRFQLYSGMPQGLNVFVDRDYLAEMLEKEGKANLILVKGEAKLKAPAKLSDYGLQLKALPDGAWELRHDQSFIPEAIEKALAKLPLQPQSIFTYFVNDVALGERHCPYSFIAGSSEPQGESLQEGECSLIQWLADDLEAKAGDVLDLEYFEIQAQGSLQTAKAQLRVKDIIPTADRRELTPSFPGFTDSESCTDWDPSIPVDTKSIREKDESYWDKYQGSPKIFISLAQAQQLFGSTHGRLSALRFEGQEAELTAQLEAALAAEISLFQNIPLKQLNEQGTDQAMDFAGLFFALSFFVIAAAIILLVLVGQQRMEAKSYDLGLLRSLGFSHGQMMKLLCGEFALYTLLGGMLGLLCAWGYVALLLYLINTLWSSISGYASLDFYLAPSDLAWGFAISAALCMLSMYGVVRRSLKASLKDQLKRDFSQSLWTRSDEAQLAWLSCGCFCYNAFFGGAGDVVAAFVTAFLFFLIFLKLSKHILSRLGAGKRSLWGLAMSNIRRNISRSMALVSVFSLGMFICLLTILNHRSLEDEENPQAGTGGYYGILETSVPIKHDLNSLEGRKEYKLQELPEVVKIQQLRVVEGAQAGCLNLNRVLRPQLLAAPAQALQGRFSFSQEDATWDLLRGDPQSRVIPAIADAEVIQWSLGLSVGDELPYIAEGGEEYRLKFVAGLQKSIFQGYVVVSEENLARMYPQLGGSQMSLLDYQAKPYLPQISRALENKGASFSTAAYRLNLFNEVQNNYLMIFFALGSIGLVMATFGLMLLVEQQLLQRRHELRVLRSIGYSRGDITRLILYENAVLLLLALIVTLSALLMGLVPLFLRDLISPPYALMALSVLVIMGSAFLLLLLLARKHSRGV